jgi:hypothetical protein
VTVGPGALLVSADNVKWRSSVLAGGVEGSKFFLFSVVLPAKCVSGVSPRFHCRRLAFCFLPLAAILESPLVKIFNVSSCPLIFMRLLSRVPFFCEFISYLLQFSLDNSNNCEKTLGGYYIA